MKNAILFTIFSILLFSCERVKDHYRIIDVEINIAKYKSGPNPFCVDFSDSLSINKSDSILIRINFVREYYSTNNSRKSGIMYSPQGWEGCKEKIKSIRINELGINDRLTNLYVDSSINGFTPTINNPYSCQVIDSIECQCQKAISYNQINSFIEAFNNQKLGKETDTYLGESMENVPLIFIAYGIENDKSVQFEINLQLDNSKSITKVSNILEIK